MLEEQHRVVTAERGAQEPDRVARPGGERDQDEHVEVEALQLARPPAGRRRRLAGHDADQLRSAADGDALHPRPLPRPEDGAVAVDDLPRAPGAGDQRALELLDDRPDQVDRVQGLARGRADVREDDEAVALLALDRGEEQQVGEAQVGQRLPGRDQPLRVTQRLAGQRGVAPRELEQRDRHGTRLVTGCPHAALRSYCIR